MRWLESSQQRMIWLEYSVSGHHRIIKSLLILFAEQPFNFLTEN